MTSIQPVAGAIESAPAVLGQIDLGRVPPPVTWVDLGGAKGKLAVAIVAGALRAYHADGSVAWTSHPPGINFSAISAYGDLAADGHVVIALQAGRSAAPFGAAILVSADDGKILWRYDVEPMSYAWYLHVIDGPKPKSAKQIVVLMQGYPPDAKNGYMVLFHHTPAGWQQKWRYDFSAYTCFPNMLEVDLDGDGVKELAIISHSRVWVMDRNTGAVKQFMEWDTSPANHRSYGENLFIDLNHDNRPDFLCLGYFAKHYEVLLNENGKLKEKWHVGWDDSVTTGKVGLSWPLPPYGDVDGDGKTDIVVSVFNGDNENHWMIRVHDAVSGEMKYKIPGLIAARLFDGGDGKCVILADRSDDGSDVGNYGEYQIQHVKGAELLQVIDGKLTPIWQEDHACAIREAAGPLRVKIGDKIFSLNVDRNGKVTQSPWIAPPAPPSEPSKIPADAPAKPSPELLAADVLGDGSNQIIAQTGETTTIWRQADGKFEQAAQYHSACLPVISDLNGDGKLDLVLADVSNAHPPRIKAITPALNNKVLWDEQLPPPNHTGLPAPRIAYMRAGKFTGGAHDDIYLWAGEPLVRSLVLSGKTGKIVWEKSNLSASERYYGPSMNLASVADFNHDGAQDLVFTNPDMYCIASGKTGDMLLGPLTQPSIFNQPSLGLYTMPAILGHGPDATVCEIGGHYFQAALSLDAKTKKWYALPVAGEARCANEGFMRLRDGTWLMGFGRQNGKFACYNLADGKLRWELNVQASCSDVCTCDINGDGNPEFIFGTSHGSLYAVADDAGKPRVVWKKEVGASLDSPILADMDGDGKTDIIVPAEDGRIRIFGVAKSN